LRFEKDGLEITLDVFLEHVKISWIYQYKVDEKILQEIDIDFTKCRQKNLFSQSQNWLGVYFKNEILSDYMPDVTIRWIDNKIGWGVFANRDFKKMQFVAVYSGNLRKKSKKDSKNSYCFEYVIAEGIATSYTIDALDCGGVSRFINHSTNANLSSSVATVSNRSYIILYTKKSIAKGEQLCYDYGPDYWSKRSKPLEIK
jgi:SET domain-containing protein